MNILEHKLAICAAISIVAHFVLERGLEQLPKYTPPAPPAIVKVKIEEREPPKEEPEPQKPPEPVKPEPQPTQTPVHEAPRPHPRPTKIATVPNNAPVPDHPAVEVPQQDTTDEPVFGVNMSSTSQGGTTSAQVGNTLSPAAQGSAAAPKPLAPVVAQYEATKMPLPQGRCFGKYTDEAKAAGVEGTVVLDLIVGEDGRAREIRVSEGLPHGLSEAAIAALRDCRFSPGEKDGKPVAVRIRGFKIHFVLAEAQ